MECPLYRDFLITVWPGKRSVPRFTVRLIEMSTLWCVGLIEIPLYVQNRCVFALDAFQINPFIGSLGFEICCCLQQLEFVFCPDKTIVHLALRFGCIPKTKSLLWFYYQYKYFSYRKNLRLYYFFIRSYCMTCIHCFLFFKKTNFKKIFNMTHSTLNVFTKKMSSECM